jgi:succinyl-diaminopimelate desuccinylase
MPPFGMLTDAAALTQELVRIRSVSGTPGEQEILRLLADRLGGAKFLLNVDVAAPERFLLARTVTAATGPVLLFVCHVDTVPVGDPASWARDPFSGDVADGRIWGRGASDMKGGLAAAVVALLRSGPEGPPAALLLTTGEELGCLGVPAAAEALTGLEIASMVVPESTENRVVLGHRGALWLNLVANGIAAHGSTPQLGRNALLAMAQTLVDIDARLPRGPGELILGPTTVNVATMAAGTAPNVVPERATATVDIRFAGAGEPAAIRSWLATYHPTLEVSTALEVPRLLSTSESSWIRSLPAELAEPPSANYFTDAAVLASTFPAASVAVWGPGQPDQAHAADESVSIEHVTAAVELYARALDDWPGSLRAPLTKGLS